MLLKGYLDNKNTRQFLSYIIVGGSATVVEWVLFWFFVYHFKLDQNLGFTIAYIISTFVNMALGRIITFKNASVVHKSNSNLLNFLKETSLIYLVAAIGCVANLLFLNAFTDLFHMNSMLAKIITTGIMLMGNYIARKYGIYRDNQKTPDMPVSE
jgi:putative flippase GtrA